MSLKYFPLIYCLLLCNISISQEYDLHKYNLKINTPSCDNRMAVRDLHQALNAGLKKNFNIHPNSIFALNSYIEIGDSKTLEGMETYIYSDVEINFDVENIVTKEILKFNYRGKGKGRNQQGSISNAIKNFKSAKNGLKELSQQAIEYMENQLNNNCNAFIDKANNAAQKGELKSALLILNSIKENFPCYDGKKLLEIKIAEQQAQEICDRQMQKIKIMVNSKQSHQMDRAIQHLLVIPPNAPCASEALELSKEIGEYIERQSGETNKFLVQYQQIQHDQLLDQWFLYFSKRELGK